MHAYMNESDDSIDYRQCIWRGKKRHHWKHHCTTHGSNISRYFGAAAAATTAGYYRHRCHGSHCYQFTCHCYFMRFDVLTCVSFCMCVRLRNELYGKRNMRKSALLHVYHVVCSACELPIHQYTSTSTFVLLFVRMMVCAWWILIAGVCVCVCNSNTV